MDINIQDVAEMLLDFQMIASISKGKQMSMQKPSAKYTIMCNTAMLICLS